MPGSFKDGQIGELEETPGLIAAPDRAPCRAAMSRPSRPARDVPAINLRYLSEEPDRRAIIGGLRLAWRIFAVPTLKPFVREESLRPARQTDAELLDHARRKGSTCYHASCICLTGTTR